MWYRKPEASGKVLCLIVIHPWSWKSKSLHLHNYWSNSIWWGRSFDTEVKATNEPCGHLTTHITLNTCAQWKQAAERLLFYSFCWRNVTAKKLHTKLSLIEGTSQMRHKLDSFSALSSWCFAHNVFMFSLFSISRLHSKQRESILRILMIFFFLPWVDPGCSFIPIKLCTVVWVIPTNSILLQCVC